MAQTVTSTGSETKIDVKKQVLNVWQYVVKLTSRSSVRAIIGLGSFLLGRKIFDLIKRKWYNLPPGPIGIPFWGKVHELGDFNSMVLAGQKYGLIHLTYFGLSRVCLINNIELFHTLFSKKEFDDREPLYAGIKPLQMPNIPSTKEYSLRRKFFYANYVNALNSKALTKSIENALKNEVFPNIDKCINNNNNNNNRWLIRNDMSYVAFSTIYASLFNKLGPCLNDESFVQFAECNHKIFDSLTAIFVFNLYVPNRILTWFIDHVLNTQKPQMKHKEIVLKWFEDNKIDNNDDVMERLISNSKLAKDTIIVDTMGAFQAGMHTTAGTMEQCILYLAKWGIEYQNELYNEIKEYFELHKGDNSEILKDSKKELPLLSSFIFEVLRQTIGAYNTFPRFITNNDYQIDYKDSKSGKYIKYTLPKGTTVYGNIAAMNFDENYFPNPFVFDPKRFIQTNNNNNNNVLKDDIGLTTFGHGRRQCPGQTLAKREIYLVLALLIEKYQFLIPQCYQNNDQFKIPKAFLDKNTPMLGVSVVKR